MASDFLTRLAKEKAKKVDKEYGASAYGGSATLRSSGGSGGSSSPSRSSTIATNGGGSGAPSTRASNFLTRLAKQKAEEIDKEYGADAYGGSQWTVLDKESGFDSWLEELNRFSQRMSDDYSSREGHYQSADTMGKYRDDAFANIGVMQNRANIYRNYFQQNRELYGDDTVDGILSALNEGGDYLEGVRSSLGSEYDYWSQWDTEDDYNNYQRRANLDIDAAKAELADLEGQLEEAKRERNTTRNIMVGSRYMTSGQIEEYGANRDEAQARYDELQGRVTALQEDIDIAERIAQGRRYSSYRDAEDWAENSQYRSTANGKEAKLNAWTGMYSETGFDDITYDYINRNEEARGHQMVNDIATNASLLGVDNSFLQQMTDDEIATFNYIYATQGADPAYEYISYLASDLNYRQRAQSEAEWAAYANEHPVGSSVFSVLESPLKGLSYIGQIADYAEDGKIDQNAGYNKFSYLNSAIRNEVTGIVEENWGGVGSFAYQTGMSMGDFLFNTAITGGNSALTLGIMGTGAAADATIDAKDRGLSDNQAFALGTIAGAAEIVTEKFSLDALLNGKWERGALQYILKNAFTEGSEEVGSDFINLFADILISKDKSEWKQSINAYQEEGMSENEAFWHSVVDQAQTMGLDFLGGAISGGVMSGGFAGIHAAGNAVYNNQTGAEFQAMGDDVVQAVIQEGLESAPSTQSYQLAQQLQQKLANGESITNGELGRLYQANIQAINAEENSGELLMRAAEEVSARGRVTNSTALDILDSPTALSALQTEAGLTLTDDMSRAQRRKAVKAAVETLASREGGVLSALRETARPETSTAKSGAQATQRTAAQTETAQNTARPSSVAQQVHNIQIVNRAAAALGQQGAKVAADFYDGSADAAAYYGAFSAYYQAGVTGMDMEKVKTGYSTALNSAQRQAAYLAGQNDAAASLAAEQAQVQYATVYGEEAGLIQNDHTARIPQTEAVYLNTLGKALGTKIEIVDAVEHGGNGAYYAADGTIRIAANAENPAMVVASHEITHRLQELAPEQYRKYRDYANGKIAEQIGRSAVEEIKARYAESGINLTTEQAMDEVAAEFTEAMVKDGKLFRDLAQDNRSVARKMLDAIRDFIRRVKAAFRGDTAAQNSAAMEKYGVDMKTLEEAARMWNEALKAGSEHIKAAQYLATEEGQRVELSDRDTRYSLREKDPPKKTGVAYKVFYAKDGQLYPPMVANPGGAGTPVGVWLDADIGQAAPPSKTGRMQVQAGGKGTNAAKGSLAFRPGWHLGDIPLAKQFARKNPETGVKDLFPSDFVWAECEYAMDVNYQEEAMSYGYTENGKFRHSYAGLPKLPTDGYYRYRTNPNPDTVPWIITGAMRVTRILTDAETDAICREAGVEPMQRQGGPMDEARLAALGLEAGDVTENTRFSLKSTAEETKTLIALHNLTESKLLSALRLGGFPMPSIAVTRTDIPHTNFGEISLVMDKRAVDPKASRKNTVYSADAWTPTFPQVEYEADTQAEWRISRRIGELSARVDPYFQDDLRRLQYGLDDYLNRHGGEEGLARWAMDNYGLKAAYLEEQGTHIEPSTTRREVEKGYNPERADKYQAIADALGTEDPDTIGSMNLKELREQHGEALEAAFPGMTKSAFRMSGILRQVQEYFRDQGGGPVYETVTDSAATRRAVDEALDRAEYERWVLDLYSGIEAASGVYNNKERFTPSGNRRSFQQTHYPVTLEGIVKAMAGQNGGNTKNVSGFYGVKSLRAGTAQRFKSIADMHKLEGRLQNLTEAEQQAISDALDERLIEITGELAEKSPGGAREYDYTQSDTIGHILVEIADGGNYTIDSIMRKFNGEYGYQIGNELAAKVRDLLFDVSQMPVNLFEAKPERAVSFDEVLAAVVPDDSSKELMDALAQARVRTLEYKSGDDADRIRQVNSVEGARFSLKSTDNKGRKLTAEQQEYFRDSKAVDKHGQLLTLYHQTEGLFTVFDPRHQGAGSRDNATPFGIFLKTSDRDIGLNGKFQMELYANITNPLYASNREALTYSLLELSDEYAAIKAEIDILDATYQEKFEQAKQGLVDFMTEWRSKNPGASRRALYDVPEFNTLYEAEDAVVEEWSQKADQLSARAKDAITTALRNAGYDGVILSTDTGSFGRSTDAYIALDPEQVKNISNKRPTSSSDIRYSLREQGTLRAADIQALYEENQLLRDRVEYWKGQTRRTKRVTTDKKAVEQAARDLIRSYDSELAVDDIAGDLQSLYDYIASGYDGKNELTYTEARRRAEAIARQLVENAVAVDTELSDQYSDLRNYLRTTRLIVSEADSHDIPDYGAWRKQRFGRLNLTKGEATNIDQVYEELSELWPEFFNSQREIHPVDQLLHIAEVADTLYDITEYNPFSQYMDQAVAGAANEVMETFFDLPQTRKTFADRQAMKLQEAKAKGQQRVQWLREQNAARLETLRQENRERVRRAVQRERDTRTRQLGRMKERYQARDTAGRERRSAAELRRKITRHAKALSQKLLRPTDKQHIPEQLRTPVAALLEAINQESQYTIDPETGKRSKNGAGDPTKRTEAFRALKEQYAKIVAEGGDMVIDPSLLGSDAEGIRGSFDAVITMGDTRLADMNAGQLATVWQVVRAVEHSVSTAGKILSKTKFAATVDWANAMQRDTASRRAKRTLTKGHPLLDLENPYTFFSHFGDAGRDIYRMLRNAQDQQQLMADEVANAVRSIVSPKTVRNMERTTRTFTTERGDKLTLSTAQIMELYELMKRTQAHDHLLKGGIVQPEIESAKIRRGTDAILLTEGDLANIVGTLTDRQVQIADGLQRLTCGLLADYGNRASMDAYGYKKFTEQSYWPIQSAKEGIRSSVERGSGQTRSIANIGMAQAVTPHANNPLDLPGLFSTFSSHAGDMIDYAAWLLPMEDANRLFNFKFRDGEGNLTGKTIKGLLDRVGGEGSQRYWHNLMEDIQNGINAPGDSPMWDKIGKSIGNFKGAAVGGNLRVIIQQPTAFFRAAAVLSPADLSRGLARGVTRGNGWKKALQYSPIAKRKDTGSFDISSPRQMNEILFDDRTPVRKLNDALSAPAGMADAITWGRLWNACEWATAREHKSLQRGSEAFYQKVNELFTEVIDQTQVVDGVLQRSNIMRSSNAVVKQATSFMGEPIMSLNMMLRAYDQVRYEQNPKRRGRAIKALGRAATALVVTNTVNALAQSIIDAMRDDDEDKKYWERFRAAFTGITGEEESAWDKAVAAVFNGNLGGNMNLLAQIPFVKDVLSLLEGYDVSRTEMEIVSDLITAGQTAIDSADGSGKRTRAYAVKQLLAAGAKVFGIPVSNLTRDIWGIARSAAVETDNIPLQYEMEKAIYNITNDGNKGRYYDILFRALVQGDMDSYEHIRRELMEQMGVDGASIDSAMRSRYSKAVEADPSFTLSQTARDLIGSWDSYGAESAESGDSFGADDLGAAAYERYASQRANDYRAMENGLESSPIFRGMSDESKDKVLKAAQDLVTKEALADNSGGQYEVTTKWMTLADDAEAMGIEPWEYVLFHVAYNEAETTRDENGDAVEGESKSDHVREWLELYAGLTDEQREFLWGTVYQSEW